LEQARRVIADCDRKLARHKAALEAGADPALVAAWSQQVQRDRATAETTLVAVGRRGAGRRMTEEEIRTLVEALGGMLAVLKEADPADKAEVYRQLGLKITYQHEERVALAEVQPRPPVGVVVVSGGGLEPPRP
jgi:site-specific DNA recombinase